MLIINLFRQMKAANFQIIEVSQIKSWTDLLNQLIRVVSEYNDWDPTRVPDFDQ